MLVAPPLVAQRVLKQRQTSAASIIFVITGPIVVELTVSLASLAVFYRGTSLLARCSNFPIATPTKVPKRSIIAKLTWSGNKRKKATALIPPPQIKYVDRVKIVEKEIHLEKKEERKFLFEGFMAAFTVMMLAVIAGLRTHLLAISVNNVKLTV